MIFSIIFQAMTVSRYTKITIRAHTKLSNLHGIIFITSKRLSERNVCYLACGSLTSASVVHCSRERNITHLAPSHNISYQQINLKIKCSPQLCVCKCIVCVTATVRRRRHNTICMCVKHIILIKSEKSE